MLFLEKNNFTLNIERGDIHYVTGNGRQRHEHAHKYLLLFVSRPYYNGGGGLRAIIAIITVTMYIIIILTQHRVSC